MAYILAQISPQRSTQYSKIANRLAPAEISLSPPGQYIASIEQIKLGRTDYLKIDIGDHNIDENDLYEFGNMAMLFSFFRYYPEIGKSEGPFLKPLDTLTEYYLPHDLVMTRRYRGKTNEMFTRFLCNIARYSSSYNNLPWKETRVFDPLAGGGTTLFTALCLGADTAGVEKRSKDVLSTVTFLKQYLNEKEIQYRLKEERLKKSVKRYCFSIGKNRKKLLLSKGDTVNSQELIKGLKKPHFIVADLPYGIQHGGEITDLVAESLTEWSSMILPGGTITMSWDSTRFSRKEMIKLVGDNAPVTVLEGETYDEMAHRVDRVIKKRDIIVARAD